MLIRQLHNVRCANNLPVCHSISSFDCALAMDVRYLVGAQRFSSMKIIQRQTAALKARKYYYLNPQTKYSSCKRIKRRQKMLK